MSACPHCQASISGPRLWWKGPFRYTCPDCGKKSRLSIGYLALCVAPVVLVVLSYYLTIFLNWPGYKSEWLLGSVIVICLSINFLLSLLMAAYGRFIPTE